MKTSPVSSYKNPFIGLKRARQPADKILVTTYKKNLTRAILIPYILIWLFEKRYQAFYAGADF
jgi:hypothetical protein